MSFAAALFLPLLLVQTTIVATPQAPRPFPAGQEASEGTGRIEGVITRSGTGEPIAGAVVHLSRVTDRNRPNGLAVFRPDDLRPSATTGAGGRFAIDGIAPGEYRIAAFRNGFVRAEYGQREPGSGGAPVELFAGQTFDASLEMIPAAIITGRVYDATGQPVPYVRVSAMQPRVLPDGREMLEGVQSTTTDDRGEYRLFWLNPGEYVISARQSGGGIGGAVVMGSIGLTVSTPNAPPAAEELATFYPGVSAETLAAPILVNAGEERVGIDLRLAPAAAFRVSGRVVSPFATSGSVFVSFGSALPAAPGAPVVTRSSRVSDPEGNFTIRNLTPGTYRLQARAEAVGGRRLSAHATVEVTNRDVDNVILTLAPGTDVSGSVFIEEAAAPRALEALADPEWTELRVTLRGDNGVRFGSDATEAGEARGSFLIENVAPGEYAVDVTMPNPDLYLKRIMLGSAETGPDAPITIEPGFTGPLFILLSPNGGRIRGVATAPDGEPMPNAAVTLLPPDASDIAPSGRNLPNRNQVRTDAGGNYSLSGIAPGEYRLFAWEDLERVPLLDEAFMSAHAARSERVAIREGDTLSVDLEVIPASDIR